MDNIKNVNDPENVKDMKKKALSEIIFFLIVDTFILVFSTPLFSYLSENIPVSIYFAEPLMTLLQISVVFIPLKIFKDKDHDLGFSKPKLWLQFIYGVLLFLVMLLIFKLFGNSCEGQPFVVNGLMGIMIWNAFSAAVTEELAYRGLLFTRFKKLSGNTAAAIAVSSVLFGASHFLVGDIQHIIMSTVTGVLLCSARAYLKNCTLISTMTAHFLYDFLMCYISI